MLNPDIIFIRKNLENFPLPEYCSVWKMHDKEIKYGKIIRSYNENIAILVKEAENLSAFPNAESAYQLMNRLKQVNVLQLKLKFSSILPEAFKVPLPNHTLAFQRIEALTAHALATVENPIALELDLDCVDAETLCQRAAELENGIDLPAINVQNVDILFTQYIQTLEEAKRLYQKAFAQGKISASEDVERTSSNHFLFKTFAQNYFGTSICGYLVRGIFSIKTFPLSYHDPRLQPIFRFLQQISNCQPNERTHWYLRDKEDKRKFSINCFIKFLDHYMALPADSAAGSIILQKASMIMLNERFIEDEKGNDEYKRHYGNFKLDELLAMIAVANETTQLAAIANVPETLSLNQEIGSHVRVKLVRHAHNIESTLKGRVDCQIDRWMAELKGKELFIFTQAEHRKNEELLKICLNYRAKSTYTCLGLILQPEDKEFCNLEKLPRMYTRRHLKTAIKADFYKGQMSRDKTEIFNEEKMIVSLLSLCNAPEIAPEFSLLLQQNLEAQKVPTDGFFEINEPQHLTAAGARALLYATGYLN